MADDNVGLVRSLYERFAARDIPGILAGFAPDIEWTVAAGFPYAGTYVGGDAVVANVFAKTPVDWDGFRHEITDVIDSGADVVVLGRYLGTWKRTGLAMDAALAHLWHLEGGKVTRFQQFVDGPSVAAATHGFEHRAESTTTA